MDGSTNFSGTECSLSGAIRTGGAASTRRSPLCRTWPVAFRAGSCEIAIDGYFVLDDRLYLGRSVEEQQEVGRLLTTDLQEFLNRLQNACCNIVIHDHAQGLTRFISDEFGCLPLYLLATGDRMLYASAYTGLATQAQLSLDPVGVAELYWFGYQLGDRTAFRNTSHIPPGSIVSVRWSDGASTTRAWTRPRSGKPTVPSSSIEMAEQVVDLMTRAASRLHRDDARYGVKISAGMDSRLISSTWPGHDLRAYTFGYPGCDEVRLSEQLSRALGMPHITVPIRGDFFSRWHAPFFPLHGITEYFHQALLTPMQADGIDMALDGLAGDVLFGGLTLRHAQSRLRMAMGLAPKQQAEPRSTEEIADYILRKIRLADAHYRPLTHDVVVSLAQAWEDIRADMVAEVKKAQARFDDFQQIYTEVIFRNRTRRYIALQGAVCRPAVESIYPFLDRDLLQLEGVIPEQWVANKRLYVEVYTHFLPKIRSVPSLLSLLPFNVPVWAHFPGRAVRYGREQAGLRLSHLTGGGIDLFASNSNQWSRWIGLDAEFRNGVRRFMEPSTAFDGAAFDREMDSIGKGGPAFASTRLMLTASYCGYFRK